MRTQLTLAVAITAAAWPSVAAAGPPIVIESYSGETGRPPDADILLQPVYKELAGRGYLLGEELVRSIDRAISRGAGQLTASQSADAQTSIDQAYEAFIEGDYTRAVGVSLQGLKRYEAAPSQMVREPKLRDLQWKGRLILARSYEALTRGEDAFRAMAETIRTFPDRHVSTAEWDPRVNALHRRVKAELVKQGTGVLDVTVDDPSAVIFYNERFAGTGHARVEGLLAGEYRVFVTKGEQSGRVHAVEVNAGATATLSVSWQLDHALATTWDRTWLQHPAGVAPQQEIAVAARIARRVETKTVILLGIREIEGRRSVTGYVVQVDSLSKRFASVQIEPVTPDDAQLAKLGAFLAGDKGVDLSGILTRELAPDDVYVDEQPAWHADRWGWGLAGGGVVLTGVAAGFLISARGLDNDLNAATNQTTRQELRDRAGTRRLIGTVLGATGVGLAIAGAVKLALTDGPPTEESSEHAGLNIVVGSHSVAVIGSF